MTTHELDLQLGDITSTLGDPTRRGIYIYVREAPGPVTAGGVAKAFHIHPNVARHHLDRLAADGFLRVSRKRPEGRRGPGAGRPAKCYEPTAKEIRVEFPARRFDLLAELLVEVVERLDPDRGAQVAEHVGFDYGRRLAAEIGLPEEEGFEPAVRAVAQALSGMGFDAAADADNRRLLYRHCPFGATAAAHPEVVCSLDQGMVKGLMAAVHQPAEPVTTPHTSPEEDCVTAM